MARLVMECRLKNFKPFWFAITSDNDAIIAAEFLQKGREEKGDADEPCCEASRQIKEWCKGNPDMFSLPTDKGEISDKLEHWLSKVSEVPCGDTMTYGQFAVYSGFDENAARAAGSACRRNPIPLIIPCHRITKKECKNGNYGNFGGFKDLEATHKDNIALKGALIEHEHGTRNGGMQ